MGSMVSRPKPFSLSLSLSFRYAQGGASFLFLPWSLILWRSNVLVSWFWNSVVVDGLIGGGFNGLIDSGFDMGTRWCWGRLWLVMGLICIWWVDPFDGFDLVLVSYGFDGFDLVLVSYGFDRLFGFDFFFFFFSYGFDWFNLRLVASVLVWLHCFDLLFWLVCWVSRTIIVMFWEEHEEHEEQVLPKKNNEKKRKLN